MVVWWINVTIGFLYETTIRVDAAAILFGLLLAQSENVLQTIQSHQHDLGVHHSQQITERFNAAQIHQISTEKKQMKE